MTNEIKNKQSFKNYSLLNFDHNQEESDFKKNLLLNINSIENKAKELREVWMRNS